MLAASVRGTHNYPPPPQGKHEEAMPLYKRSRAIREKVLGPDHPLVAESLNNQAALLKKMVGSLGC